MWLIRIRLMRALDLAAKESAAAQVYAKGIEKFIEGK